MVFVLLWLPYLFSLIPWGIFSRFNHIIACANFLFRANRYSTVCLDHLWLIHPSADTWLAPSTLRLLWIKLLWAVVDRDPSPAFSSFGLYLEVGLLDQMVDLCLIFGGITVPFSTVAVPFLHSHQQCTGVQFPHTFTNPCEVLCFFVVTAIRLGMKR